MSILLFLAILAILIIAHEFGHFIVAKWVGMRVDEFAVGFPPKLFGRKIGETTYRINLLPIGGYVKIFGEDTAETETDARDAHRSFSARPRHIQATVVGAGVVFNIILAWLFLSAAFMVGMPRTADDPAYGYLVSDPKLTIITVLPESPAAFAGLKSRDIIASLASGGAVIVNPTPEEISAAITGAGSNPVTLEVIRRGDEPREFTITPREGILEGKSAIGISMDMVGTLRLSPLRAFYEGALATGSFTEATVAGIWGFFSSIISGTADFSQVTGPVGIVGVVSDASSLGFVYILTLTALISINLAIINMVPFPALDGGRILFIAIEAIKRSPIPPKIVYATNMAGFALLILLMAVITYHDIVRLLST